MKPWLWICFACLVLAACPTVNVRLDDAPDGGCTASGCAVPSLHCEPESQACVECLSATDCVSPRAHCDGASHRCVECDNDVDCGPNAVCVIPNHLCIHGCTQASECTTPEAPVCDDGVCMACETDAHCSAPLLCDLRIRRCVRCIASSDCSAPTPVCDLRTGTCVGCDDSAECAATQVCEPVQRVCQNR